MVLPVALPPSQPFSRPSRLAAVTAGTAIGVAAGAPALTSQTGPTERFDASSPDTAFAAGAGRRLKARGTASARTAGDPANRQRRQLRRHRIR